MVTAKTVELDTFEVVRCVASVSFECSLIDMTT
jgi:hypothetical protein